MRFLYALTLFIAIIFIFFVVSIAIQHEGISPKEPETGHAIYITRTDRIRTMDGRDIWLLEYTIDGVLQSPAFNSLEAMTEYREYLDTIGKVYQREDD